jgi:hypothetical protein
VSGGDGVAVGGLGQAVGDIGITYSRKSGELAGCVPSLWEARQKLRKGGVALGAIALI